ncbi:MAG: PEP-CTERM sorting domain-containing protein [Planctomycetes bacterium]|nr:PEP-CTERM sorting domain-containing protein [Planctomycetota bacterium]
MSSLKWLVVCVVAITTTAMCGPAWAVTVIDGNASVADGYASLSVQNTDTQFGDATTGDPINGGGGSEIDQVFAKIENGRLYMVIAGNLETNFNKLDLYIDSTAGGVNQIIQDGAGGAMNNVPAGVDPFSGGAFEGSNGLTFDAGFTADYFLSFAQGFEKLRPTLPSELQFYAATVHFADLTQGTTGAVVVPGMQLAQRGLPQVLRGTTADFDTDGNVDGGEFLTWQSNYGATGVTRNEGDASGNGSVDDGDYATWESNFGYDVANSTLADYPFAPQSTGIDNSEALLGPTLPGLSQGDLIDKNYALGAGGCNADNSGADCIAKELEFALDVELINDPGNTFSHRNMENTIDLQMAFDNSNVDGVDGGAANGGNYTIATPFDPSLVTTGIEFSIPLSQIGNPGAGDVIQISAFINNGSRDFLANQFAGDGILLGNLGNPASNGLDLGLIAGNQFVSIGVPGPAVAAVPEPSSLALICLGTIAGLVGRRRRS